MMASNSCARLEMHPSGKFLYAANRGHDSIAGYAINSDGSLNSIGYFPTERTPRDLSGLTRTGKFMISAGQSADRLISYRIDADGGYLYPSRNSTMLVRCRGGCLLYKG